MNEWFSISQSQSSTTDAMESAGGVIVRETTWSSRTGDIVSVALCFIPNSKIGRGPGGYIIKRRIGLVYEN